MNEYTYNIHSKTLDMYLYIRNKLIRILNSCTFLMCRMIVLQIDKLIQGTQKRVSNMQWQTMNLLIVVRICMNNEHWTCLHLCSAHINFFLLFHQNFTVFTLSHPKYNLNMAIMLYSPITPIIISTHVEKTIWFWDC